MKSFDIKPLILPPLSKNKNPFSEWHEKSSVRSRENTYDLYNLDLEYLKKTPWFTNNSLPYLADPRISNLGEDANRYITASHLVNFLEYTTLLEHRIVNKAIEYITQESLVDGLPTVVRKNALLLYTDEAYHALISDQVADQVAEIFNINTNHKSHVRVTNLEKIANDVPEDLKAITWFLIAFVSETVISKSFLTMSKSTLIEPIYDMLKDHLEDECVHAKYFADLFPLVWENIRTEERKYLGEILIKIIRSFATIDKGWHERNLSYIGANENLIQEISDKYSSREILNLRVKDGCIGTFRALKRAGFFNDRYMKDLFTREGLL